MGKAKAVALNVRASQTSHLCFDSGGVMGELNAELGSKAPMFDYAAFHAILGSMPTIPGPPARLLYDFLEIQGATKPFALASLRAEPNKAALAKAVNARANAYYAKYANTPAIIAKMDELYSPAITGSKPVRLAVLKTLSERQMTQLQSAYEADGRTAVVRNTQSKLHSTMSSFGSTITEGHSDERDVTLATDPKTFDAPPQEGYTAFKVTGGGDQPVEESVHMGIDDQKATSLSEATDDPTILNTDYSYRVP